MHYSESASAGTPQLLASSMVTTTSGREDDRAVRLGPDKIPGAGPGTEVRQADAAFAVSLDEFLAVRLGHALTVATALRSGPLTTPCHVPLT